MNDSTRCGYVGLIGRPNVGKSTLLNHIMGMKLAITSRKPQTTRDNLLGIATRGNAQMLFVDTPGIHSLKRGKTARQMNRYMVNQAISTLGNVDVAILLIDALGWTEEDSIVLKYLARRESPVILGINKVDKLRNKTDLLPLIEELRDYFDFKSIVPLSALRGHGLKSLEDEIIEHLPLGPHAFGSEELTDKPMMYLASEAIREKVMRQLGDEVPHRTAVGVERYEVKSGLTEIDAIIYVERESHKSIMIGKQGKRLKSIGTQARIQIEYLVQEKVMLNLWVKVRSDWSESDSMLKKFGYV